jgi:hypothetical protein
MDYRYTNDGYEIPEGPDYTSESSSRSLLAEVEAKVISEVGYSGYGRHLRQEMNTIGNTPDGIRGLAATAPAAVRAMACAKVMGWEG